jgi:hypothetical protein
MLLCSGVGGRLSGLVVCAWVDLIGLLVWNPILLALLLETMGVARSSTANAGFSGAVWETVN